MTANLAFCALEEGKRVAILDADIEGPCAHHFFGYGDGEIRLTLLDYLWGRCDLEEIVYDATDRVAPSGSGTGRCFLIPASGDAAATTRVLDRGFDVDRLDRCIRCLPAALQLDVLLVDTHQGLNRSSLVATENADRLLLLLRPAVPDYQGTAVMNEVACRLGIRDTFLFVNKVLPHSNQETLRERVEEIFGHPVVGMLPLSNEFAAVGSRDFFVRLQPEHPISHELRGVFDRCLA